jgi:hypothetical protein
LSKCAAILRIRRSFSLPASALVPLDLFIHGAAFPRFFRVRQRMVPKGIGVNGVFVFISGAMLIVICAIGLLGPRTRDVALGSILR